MRNLHFIPLLLMLVGASASTHPLETETTVDVKFDYWIFYSSASGTLRKGNCHVPENEFELAVNLPSQTLDSIGAAAAKAGFFSAQSPLPGPRLDPEAVQITAPCAESTLDIRHGGKRNAISWSCNTVGGNTPPQEAKDAYAAIRTALHPYVSQLPDYHCVLR